MESINGILPLYKPVGPTSHDMVSWLRKKLNIKRIGHSGTLDPFAQGVLVMGIGKGTRILEYLKDAYKVYTMTFRLGLMTDTYDIEGKVISNEEVYLNESDIVDAVMSMQGFQKQVPPLYSAKKYQGKKLYEYARKGKIIKMPPRDVEIQSIEILKLLGRDITLQATVSAGTYMRSLAFDIGMKLGTTACAVDLIRNSNGRFEAEMCLRMEENPEYDLDKLSKYMISLSDALSEFPVVKVDNCFEEKVLNGNPVRLDWVLEKGDFKKEQLLRIVNEQNELIALGYAQRNASFFETLKHQARDEIVIRIKKVFGTGSFGENKTDVE
ncbi:MAG TPA: tRNA pseudouridine(55) synthase TruB [Thermotogota bacterium]|nr:tRNA pseudouridine(55) synthase TruB [Thermotogota bacterium]HRW33440.1 tRNA pseudouridine(55) synthase TruB [Thermotogota bacterium]